jgi:hypothetical protein
LKKGLFSMTALALARTGIGRLQNAGFYLKIGL